MSWQHMKKQSKNVIDMFNKHFDVNMIIPENAQFSTVIGAALSYFNK